MRDFPEHISTLIVQNEFDRDKTWAGDTGAAYRGINNPDSLDCRLKTSRFYRDQIVTFLTTLTRYTTKATELLLIRREPLEEAKIQGVDDSYAEHEPSSDEESPWELSETDSANDSELVQTSLPSQVRTESTLDPLQTTPEIAHCWTDYIYLND